METNTLDPYYSNLVTKVCIKRLLAPNQQGKISEYTNNFEEPYVRILIQRGKGVDEQCQILKGITRVFEKRCSEPYCSFADKKIKIKEYLTRYSYELREYGHLLEADERNLQFDLLLFDYELHQDKSDDSMPSDPLSLFDAIIAQGVQRLETLKNDIVNQLRAQQKRSEDEKEQLRKERDQYRKWRETPEYTNEVVKLQKDMIPVVDIKKGILNVTRHCSSKSELRSYLLNIDETLRDTVWDSVRHEVEEEAYDCFEKLNPSTSIDFKPQMVPGTSIKIATGNAANIDTVTNYNEK